MKITDKHALTILAIVLIVTAIVFLEMQKPKIEKTKGLKAPDFAGIESWINSEPLTIEQLRGKVVLVDFWTYSCINCIRTLPYLREWDKKYGEHGLVIVGVHTPEFDFEKKRENVVMAAEEHHLEYPIAQDNDYGTWRAYQNRFWPHKFLIDIEGNIRYDRIGEGGYEETEKKIVELLEERNKRRIEAEMAIPNGTLAVDYEQIRTPEIYFGHNFNRGNFGNAEGINPQQVISYKIPASISPNNAYLEGAWRSNADFMELVSGNGNVLLIYHAKYVNIVAGSESGSNATIYLDHKPQATYRISESKLYNLAIADYQPHIINISVEGKGFRIYTFTFG